jgi:rubrerythrin
VDWRTCRRRELFRGVFAGAAIVTGASLFGRVGTVLGASSQAQDVRILNLALRLEYTEAAFYGEALRNGSLRGELLAYAEAVEAHEQDHVQFLREALGSEAVARPSFDFGRATQDPDTFTRTAIRLEDLAVAGYNGQATNLSPATLAAAAKIVSVEARHAAWIREISGRVAAPDAVDKPITAAELEQRLEEIGMQRR